MIPELNMRSHTEPYADNTAPERWCFDRAADNLRPGLTYNEGGRAAVPHSVVILCFLVQARPAARTSPSAPRASTRCTASALAPFAA